MNLVNWYVGLIGIKIHKQIQWETTIKKEEDREKYGITLLLIIDEYLNKEQVYFLL